MSGHAPQSSQDGFHGSEGIHVPDAHELSDANFTKAVWIIPTSMVILAVFAVVCYFYTASALTHEMTWKQTHGAEIDNQRLTAFETEQAQSMHQYQMSKTSKGMAAIPIEKAMQMMVEQNASHAPTGNSDTVVTPR